MKNYRELTESQISDKDHINNLIEGIHENESGTEDFSSTIIDETFAYINYKKKLYAFYEYSGAGVMKIFFITKKRKKF